MNILLDGGLPEEIGGYPIYPDFRNMIQFERALAVLDGTLRIYEVGGGVRTVEAGAGETGGISLPGTNAYANEIRYFADCVKAGRDCDIVKPEELETVIDILRGI